MTIPLLLSFITLSFLYCSAPGPTMLFVIAQGISNERRTIMFGVISGILCANVIMVVMASVGLGSIVRDSHLILNIIKYIGVAYLLYLGIRSLLRSFQTPSISNSNQEKMVSVKLAFIRGFLTSITNPKAVLFYMAFLPQFFSGNLPYHQELLILGLGNVVIVFIVMSTYGMLANRISKHLMGPKAYKYVNRFVGVSFLGFSAALVKYKPT